MQEVYDDRRSVFFSAGSFIPAEGPGQVGLLGRKLVHSLVYRGWNRTIGLVQVQRLRNSKNRKEINYLFFLFFFNFYFCFFQQHL